MKNTHFFIQTDGGSRGNPGPAATGYVIYSSDNSEVARGGTYLGIQTNNIAEYTAVHEALQAVLAHKPTNITFRLDSELIVRQMNGVYKIKHPALTQIADAIKQCILTHNLIVTFLHIPRSQNAVADSMVNTVLDAAVTEQD